MSTAVALAKPARAKSPIGVCGCEGDGCRLHIELRDGHSDILNAPTIECWCAGRRVAYAVNIPVLGGWRVDAGVGEPIVVGSRRKAVLSLVALAHAYQFGVICGEANR
ncbi:hypothetical protein D2E70_17445 [Mycobacteroides abscessus]|uniref:hypothetical protein n=1 Tax=Mycobacteroides abscessus TaxID=36809 RepID=UPI000E69B14F|nr:hypothetical protein [Mycobacteroides abscessus]RIS67739.1 hypothetical protein D2E70_17445 [Mycobacteroides abscessus]